MWMLYCHSYRFQAVPGPQRPGPPGQPTAAKALGTFGSKMGSANSGFRTVKGSMVAGKMRSKRAGVLHQKEVHVCVVDPGLSGDQCFKVNSLLLAGLHGCCHKYNVLEHRAFRLRHLAWAGGHRAAEGRRVAKGSPSVQPTEYILQ